MTTFYLDPVGGNDANDGTTFANRWLSLTSGATAARIAPGDEIRVIANPAPVDTGLTATYANYRLTSLSATAGWSNIYLSGAWTAASANVTISTSTTRKLGTNTVSVAVGAAFTTGKAAYLNLGSAVNYSGFQQVTFWINMTAGTMNADTDVSLCLCSDTAGNTVVNTIPVPRIQTTSRYVAVTFDNGAALGSSIQSVALYINSDLGAQTFLINNVMAITAPSSANAITLNSLVGPTSTGPWYTIQSINGSNIVLEPDITTTQPAGTNISPCSYTSGTGLAVWRMEPLILPSALRGTSASTNFGLINDSGTAGVGRVNAITISGGWNRTDMSTQTGESYISSASGNGYGISATGKNWITISKVSFVRFYVGIDIQPTCTNWLISDMDILGSALVPTSFTSLQASEVSLRQCTNQATISASGVNNTYTVSTISGCQSTAIALTGAFNTTTIGQIQTIGTNSGYLVLLDISSGAASCTINVGKIGGVGGGVVYSNNIINITSGAPSVNNTIKFTDTVTVTSQATNSLLNCTTGMNTRVFVNNQSISARQNVFSNTGSGNTTNGTIIYDAPAGTATIQGASDVTFVNTAYSAPTFAAGSSGFVRHANVADVVTDQRTTYPSTFGSITTNTTTRHTASGVSWKMAVANSGAAYSPSEGAPMTLPVAKIAVNASTLVTATIWVYRTSSNVVTKFVCPGRQIAGVDSDVVATASGANNTWEQLTITFTPSAAGVVALEVDCYGNPVSGTGIAGDVYVDDFEATQA